MSPSRWLGGLATLVAVAFLVLAGTRRLNFDESLALRAGLLEVERADASPPFVMPYTLALGMLATAIRDPGWLFVLARLVTAAGVLALAVAAFRALGLTGERLALATLLTLGQAAFVVHGLEFRYDAAIAAGLLALAIAVADPARLRPLLAGVALGWLALHHLKGVALAAVLAPLAIARLRGERAGLGRLALGVAASVGAWLALVATLGLGERWLATLRGFATLAAATTRVPFGEALGDALLRDLAWWLLVLAGLAAALHARWRERRSEPPGNPRRAPGARETVALALGGAALGFVVLHPHPWAYMLALPAPFLAAIVGLRLPSRDSSRAVRLGWLGVALVGIALQAAAVETSVLSAWRGGFSSPSAPEVEVLRRVREGARRDDQVLDPSGLVYFLPPCTREWYLDTLFAERAARGEWMQELAGGVPAACTVALNSYRLGALPGVARASLARDFVLLRSGIAVRRGDARADDWSRPVSGIDGRVESFW